MWAIKFIANLPWKKFKLHKPKFYFHKWEDYWTFTWTTSVFKLYRVQEGWKNLLYQWMQLSVACLVPYSSNSILFHSYSLLNIAVAHQTFDRATSALLIKFNICCTPKLDRAAAYCVSALLIKLKTNPRWNSWASNCTSCFNAGRMS